MIRHAALCHQPKQFLQRQSLTSRSETNGVLAKEILLRIITFFIFLVAFAVPRERAFAQATDDFGAVEFGVSAENEIVQLATTLHVPRHPKKGGTLFVWPGLQPGDTISCRSITASFSRFSHGAPHALRGVSRAYMRAGGSPPST
jgi:hypothetical protein